MGTEHEDQVRSWGFDHVMTWTDEPNRHYEPHAHDELTCHLVLAGEMIVLFHDDKEAGKKSFGPGARVDVAIGRVHEVWIGKEGCVSVIGS